MCRMRGAGEPVLLVRILAATAFACAASRRRRPDGRRLERRPLRDPGRRLARPRARHARRAARPARAARHRPRPLQPALGSDRGGPRRAELGGQRRRARGLASAAASRRSSVSSGRRAGRTGAGHRTSRPGGRAFAAFARDAATRYRWVKQWLVWNEPNQARWLRPTTPAVYVRQLLNPAYAAIHAVIPGVKVAGGVTAPRASTGGVSPVAWIRGMRSAGARLDAYAHHPYPSSTRETPFSGGCKHCTTITMATLERLLSEVGRAFGPKRIWLTEYGYQTGRFGVSQQRQAELIGQSALRAHKAPRVDMLIHYLVKDEPAAERFQSGLFQLSGRPKLAALAFPLPLAQAGRSGGKLVLWGQVRPRSGVQTFRVQVRTGGVWRDSGGVRRTGAARLLQRRRARGPRDGGASLLAAGRRVQRVARRSLDGSPARAAARFRAMRAPPALYGGFAARLAFLVVGLFLCALRDRLLPRVGARPAALGRAAPGACGAARHLVRSGESSRLGRRARALVGAAGPHRAGHVPQRAPDRLVPDRARPAST